MGLRGLSEEQSLQSRVERRETGSALALQCADLSFSIYTLIIMPGTLSNIQIDRIARSIPGYGGCYAKDQIPRSAAPRWYIVNMQNHTGGGTHWVLLYNCRPSSVIYFDSYGEVPPTEVQRFMDRTRKRQYINQEEVQQLNSDWCGWYCLTVAKQLVAGKSLAAVVHSFSTNPDVNDAAMLRSASRRRQR